MREEVAATTVVQRWPSFRDVFFALPNTLRIGSGITALDRLVATADELIAQEPPKPVVLPARASLHVDRISDGWQLTLRNQKTGDPHLTGTVTAL